MALGVRLCRFMYPESKILTLLKRWSLSVLNAFFFFQSHLKEIQSAFVSILSENDGRLLVNI